MWRVGRSNEMQRLPILEVVARRVMEGGEKLCGVEQEGGECHVREELVGRRHADNGRSERVRREGRAMNTLVVRLSFSPRPST